MSASPEPTIASDDARPGAAARPDRIADGFLAALPEPALLVTSGGTILAANAPAAALLGAAPAALRGAALGDHVADDPAALADYLAACARTRAPRPGALRPRPPSAAEPARQGVTGAVVEPASAGSPAVVLLRVRHGEGPSRRFRLLNDQLAQLTREVRARRTAEAALRQANVRLQDQALELELANQQLHEQAVELEQQIDQSESFAGELERTNAELVATAAAADAARTAAEQANRAKSEFLAMMSHELRTPLNAIGGYAELLELEVHAPLVDEQREHVGRIRRSQRHLLGLINQLLDFARLEAGQAQFALDAVPLAPLLRDVEALIAPQLRSAQLHLVTEGADTALHVLADPDKLQQVLLNLLANAVKFTLPGGTITIGAAREPGTDGAAVADRVRITVRDTGVGISADHVERIFEPFVQLDQSLTRRHEGAGLGLAISRDLVRGMGGELTVASTPGEGSAFTVWLRDGHTGVSGVSGVARER